MGLWEEAPLEKLCVLGPQYGANAKAVPASGLKPRYIRITDITSDGDLLADSTVEADSSDSEPYELEDGDVLFARSGATVGKTYLHWAANSPAVFAGYLIRFRPDPAVLNPRYLFYFTKSERYLTWVESKRRVAAQPNINGAEYAALRIPLPPLSEQRRIVEILDQADHLRRLRTDANTKADRILPALFLKMFGDPATWEARSDTKPLGQLILPLLGGATPSKDNPAYWNGAIPWVSPKAMKRDVIADTERRVTALALEKSPLRPVAAGAVLIVVRGMILAHSVPVAIAGRDLVLNQDMKALRPKEPLTGEFLFGALRTAEGALLSRVRTAAHGTRKLNTEDLLDFRIPSPEESQVEAFTSAYTRLSVSARQRTEVSETIGSVNHALVHGAFSGDLTASWREAHLNELRMESAAQAKALQGVR